MYVSVSILIQLLNSLSIFLPLVGRSCRSHPCGLRCSGVIIVKKKNLSVHVDSSQTEGFESQSLFTLRYCHSYECFSEKYDLVSSSRSVCRASDPHLFSRSVVSFSQSVINLCSVEYFC